MQLTVLLFAAAKAAVGASRVQIEICGSTHQDAAPFALSKTDAAARLSCTGSELLIAIAEAYPEVCGILSLCVLAVNHEYATDSSIIHEGDEIALIPPISGG
eukprot:GHVQ01018452.1.p2 GENE.GHVQ01018452.1~~GHVQ01018452.1.p2  ORF type:complete len:102 (+),score=13.85 GHVQ01018452.1:1858-2163(+)